MTGDLTVDAAGPERRVAGTVSMAHLNVAPLMRRDAAATVDRATSPARRASTWRCPSAGAPMRGTYTVNARTRADRRLRRAQRRRARAHRRARRFASTARPPRTAAARRPTGIVTAGRPVALDLAGRAADVDLRNLPPVLKAPGVPSNLQFAYTLTGRGGVLLGRRAARRVDARRRLDRAGHDRPVLVWRGARADVCGAGTGQQSRRPADRPRVRDSRARQRPLPQPHQRARST